MSRVRPAVFSDAIAIDAVQRRNGLGGLDLCFWEHNCQHNPYQSLYPSSPPGWVLEDDQGQIAGSLINVLLPGEWKGRTIRSVASGSWCVDAEHRSLLALRMLMEWFRQPDAEMWIVGTANVTATQVFARQTVRIPMAEYLDAFFWILDDSAFAHAVLRKKGVPAAGIILSHPAGWGLRLYRALKRSGSPSKKARYPVHRGESFNADFDEFWEKLRAEGSRFRVLRTTPMLLWRFASALQQNKLTLLTVRDGGSLRGYAILVSHPRQHLGLRQNLLMDLQALQDDPDVLDSLLEAAIEESRAQGMHALEWQGFHPNKRQIALRRNPFHYHYSVWPLYYKARDPQLQQQLNVPGLWDFGPMDAF